MRIHWRSIKQVTFFGQSHGRTDFTSNFRAVSYQEVLSRQAKRFHVLDRVSIRFLRRFLGRTRGLTSRLGLNSSHQLWSTTQDKRFYALSEFGARDSYRVL